jgi:hypothetical protein
MTVLFVFWMIGICSMFDTRVRIESVICVKVRNGILEKNYVKMG